jgi:hypothetical protein
MLPFREESLDLAVESSPSERDGNIRGNSIG